ncbi:DUF5818 domain-containing protein [Sphingobium estronivorans]|uniref:DUF5818 domain-containing protein n=1 Tax=Sphingobium estronivorans TaxID=1577690 RepID=UPI003B847CD2
MRPRPISETGLLLTDKGRLILQMPGGGAWRLEAPRKIEKMLGRRVTVTGYRVDFDVIEVDKCLLI